MSQPLIVVCNRVHNPSKAAAGGAAVTLAGHHNGYYIGPLPGGLESKVSVSADGKLTCLQFPCDKGIYDKYYSLASREIWLDNHGIQLSYADHRIPRALDYASSIDPEELSAFREMNHMMAEQVVMALAQSNKPEDVLINAQDFHTMGLAKELNKLGVKNPKSFFLHTPFQNRNVLPVQSRLQIDGLVKDLLEFDLVGFQTQKDADNFMRFAERQGAQVHGGDALYYNNRRISVAVLPVGIDPAFYLNATYDKPEPHDERINFLSVDRFDPTKFYLGKNEAFREFIAENPSLLGKVQFDQIAPPSRENLQLYVKHREAVERLVHEINDEFPNIDRPLVRLFAKLFARSDLRQMQANADVFVAASEADGFHLGVYEVVAAKEAAMRQHPEVTPAVLIVSKGAGASTIVGEHAILVEPRNQRDLVEAFGKALRMPLAERRAHHDAIFKSIEENTDVAWLDKMNELTIRAAKDRYEPLFLQRGLADIVKQAQETFGMPPTDLKTHPARSYN